MNKNGEGYVDPTPGAAFGNIRREEHKREAIDAALSVPEFSAGMTEQEKEEYKENVIRKIHENI